MPIFRVRGQSSRGANSETRTVYIECPSEAVARNEAISLGLANTTRVVAMEREDLPPDVTVHRPRTRFRTRPRGGTSELLERPVRTIATGVFVGLLAWSIFSSCVGIVLYVVLMDLGRALANL